MTELLFPESGAAGPVPARGVLARWLAVDGGRVSAGLRLAEVRRGESTGYVRAPATGTLWHLAREGEVFAPGSPIGVID